MPLCCATCGTWTVEIAGAQRWTAEDRERDFVTGRCETCGSVQLIDPSVQAVERMAMLLKAAQHAEKIANG